MNTFSLPDRLRAAALLLPALLLFSLPAQPVAAETEIPWPPGEVPGATIAPPGTPTPVHYLNRAGLVIRYGDGSVQTRCVHFSGDYTSGDELLALSGLSPAFSSEGAVCAIGGEGCPVEDCFCQCPFPDCQYWAYYHLIGRAWRYSPVGPYGWMIRDGDVDGWSWGPGDFSEGVLPPVIPFEQICPAAEQTPVPTATVWPTATPWPTATIGYTRTPSPTPTATPAPPPAEIPEPATLLLLLPGLAALGAWAVGARRRKL